MNAIVTRSALAILLLAPAAGCDQPVEPGLDMTGAPAMSGAPSFVAVNGTFTQISPTSIEVSSAGGNTIIEQTMTGTVTGTLSGTFTDRWRVIIHSNGRFLASGTIFCQCTFDGKQGVLELNASDTGELISPVVASWSGHATITSASGDLAGIRGSLVIAGTVDVPSGLSTYDYSGSLHIKS